MTKAKQKTESTPKELPRGWKLDEWSKDKIKIGYRAINPERGLQTANFATEQEMIAAAHGIEAAEELGVLGLAGKGVVSRSPEANGNSVEDEQSLEKALLYALDQEDGRWAALRQTGAADEVLKGEIGKALGISGGASVHGSYCYKGGKNPEFSWPGMVKGPDSTTLKGKRLLAKVRQVMEIGAPGAPCILCGEPVERGHLCEPGKEPKPLVEPSPLCVCGHRADAHAPFNSHEEPPRECVECKCDLFVAASTAPPAIAMLRAIPNPAPASKASPGAKSAQKRAAVKVDGQADEPDDWETRELKAPIEYEDQAVREAKRFSEIMGDEPKRACRVCGCTDLDCRQCVEKTGEPCYWVEADLCSACAGLDSNGHSRLQMIPLEQITPWRLGQMRKIFDPAKMQELADSIEEKGVLQPILIRPIPQDEQGFKLDRKGNSFDVPAFEIVAGERRWRASKLAKLAEIPAIVRRFTDKEALEIQVVENLQRVDLSPIEEAEGYKRLLDEHGYTAEGLAGKLSKSKSYVYGRLKLCVLPLAAIEALAKGDLPATVGELIGRLPSMEMREEFWEDNFYGIGNDYFEMPSFRDVKLEIEGHYMRELKSSSFSQADKKLLPEAGSCKDCPKRTGNNRVDYPDGRADVCTDVPCYERKVEAHFTREAEKAKESGMKVLSQSEARKIFHGVGDTCWLTSEGRQKYVQLEDSPRYDTEKRSYKELLDGHLKPVIVIDSKGKSHLLAPRTEAERIVKEQHDIKPDSPSSNHDSYKASCKKREEEKKLRQATAEEISRRAVSDLEYNLFGDLDFLRVIAKLLIHYLDVDIRDIAKRRGIEYDAKDMGEAVIDRLAGEDLPGFIVEWFLLDDLDFWVHHGAEQNRAPLCGYFDLKPKAVMKEVSAKLKAEAKEAAKAKPKPKAKAVARA